MDKKIRILVVDDQPKFREVLCQMIEEQSDMEVVGEAEDGYSAIKQYKKLKPDLVCTDIIMPIMDGFTMTKKICEVDPRANILFCCASLHNEEHQKRAKEMGAKVWLSKPFSNKEYVDIVHKATEEKRFCINKNVLGRMPQEHVDLIERKFDRKKHLSALNPHISESLKIRILIVDDDKYMVEALAAVVEQEEKMNVAGVAFNGKEAVEKCKDLKPDIVLMDDCMPEMTGLEAAKIMRQRFPQLKVIMTTARMPEGPAQAKEAGAVAVLVKPCSGAELITVIRSVEDTEEESDTEIRTGLSNPKPLAKTKNNVFQKAYQTICELTDNWEASPGDFARHLRKKRIPHLSYTRISSLRFCPYRYFLGYIECVELEPPPSYFIKGKLFHEAAALMYTRMAAGANPDPAKLGLFISDRIDGDDRNHFLNATYLMWENRWIGWEIVLIEKPFVLYLEPELPPVVGVIDLLLRNQDHYVIVDHKTGSNFHQSGFFNPSQIQLAIYKEYVERTYGTKSCSTYYDKYRWVNNLQRIRKPAFEREEVQLKARSWESARQSLRDSFLDIQRYNELVHYPKNGRCFRCPYREVC